MATRTRAACLTLFTFLVVLSAVSASDDDFGPSPNVDTLDINNNCSFRVAPVISPRQGSPPLSFTPVELKGYEYALGIPMPHGWSGRIWGRTGCSTDVRNGSSRFTCATGDCGSGRLDCDGGSDGPVPVVATVAEFALGGGDGRGKGGGTKTDAYNISVADGYNLPMLVTPYDTSQLSGRGGQCAPAQCVVDLNDGACPPDQQVNVSGRVVACRPPSGNSGSGSSLQKACPTARSHAVVDKAAAAASTASFSCAVVNNTYTVTFCPDNSEFDPAKYQ